MLLTSFLPPPIAPFASRCLLAAERSPQNSSALYNNTVVTPTPTATTYSLQIHKNKIGLDSRNATN